MNHQILYIVGNGFDLHHQIKSGYLDFRENVKTVDRLLYDAMEQYIRSKEDWSYLEADLGDFDADVLLQNNSSFLVPYSDEEWSESSHHDFQFEVYRVVKALSITLKKRLRTWILGLQIPDNGSFDGTLLNLDRNARYITFNYTCTLQGLYRVSQDNVLHIHGEAMNEESDLVLGHARTPGSVKPLNDIVDIEVQDPRITEANDTIDQYFSDTYKPAKEVIAKHSSFFKSLNGVTHINVMGHSLSEVDLPYLVEIVKNIDKDRVRWAISCYDKASVPKIAGAMTYLGIRPSHTSLMPMSHF